MKRHEKQTISLNAISSAVQIIITGLTFFILYRIIFIQLGKELIGVWALVLATSSLGNLANFGMTSGLVKFVAQYKAQKEYSKINKLIFTSFISMSALLIAICAIIYFLSVLFISDIIEVKFEKIAIELLPLSLFSLLINSLGSIFTSTIEGFQKNSIRNIIYIISSIGFLIGSIIIIPYGGIMGLAWMQVLQSIIVFVLSLIYVKKLCPTFSTFLWSWDFVVFKELFAYGVKFQIITIFQLSYEPLTKILISKFSGVAVLGSFEIANRLINQIRAIITTMNGVTIPIVSEYSQTDKAKIYNIYKRSFSFIIFLVFPIVSATILFLPHLSIIWLGTYDKIFINSAYILSLSLLINILNAPAYFNSLGEGNLNNIIFQYILVAFLNIILGIILGFIFHGYGVIFGWSIAYAAGSIYLVINYHNRNNINFKELLTKHDIHLIIGGLIFSVISILFMPRISYYFNYNFLSFGILCTVFIVFFIILMVKNDNYKSIRGLITNR